MGLAQEKRGRTKEGGKRETRFSFLFINDWMHHDMSGLTVFFFFVVFNLNFLIIMLK